MYRKGQTVAIKNNGRTIAVHLSKDQTSAMYVYGVRVNGKTRLPIGKGYSRVYLIDGGREVSAKD